MDVDGSAFYSRVVAIQNRSKGFEIVGIYPTLLSYGQLKVNLSSANDNKVEFYIVNAAGQIVKRLRYSVIPGENIINLNLSELASGIYQLAGLNSEGQMRSFRFIKQ